MPCRNPSFLVIEDHEFQRRCIAQLLTSLGAAAVHCAEDGQTALKLIAEFEHPIAHWLDRWQSRQRMTA